MYMKGWQDVYVRMYAVFVHTGVFGPEGFLETTAPVRGPKNNEGR